MRNYEVLLLISPTLEQERIESIHNRITSTIEQLGGSISKVDVWGKRRLAYEIKGHRDGFYTLMQFQLPPEKRGDLDHTLRLTDGIIRFLITRFEPPKVKEQPAATKADGEEEVATAQPAADAHAEVSDADSAAAETLSNAEAQGSELPSETVPANPE